MLTYFAYFIIYAFLGWCCEVGYAAAIGGRFVNRGFLNGPLCPIYGIGAVTVISVLSPLSSNLPVLFVGAVLLTSLLEWFTGFILEKFFNEKWWDYSDEPFNIGGWVCLKFSLLWGGACCVVVKAVHPVFVIMINAVPHTLLLTLDIIISAALLSDIGATVGELLKLRKTLRVLDDAEQKLGALSDKIGAQIADKVIDGKRLAESREASELRAKCTRLLEESAQKRKTRLMRAFPNLSKRHNKPLERMKLHLEKLHSQNAAEHSCDNA